MVVDYVTLKETLLAFPDLDEALHTIEPGYLRHILEHECTPKPTPEEIEQVMAERLAYGGK